MNAGAVLQNVQSRPKQSTNNEIGNKGTSEKPNQVEKRFQSVFNAVTSDKPSNENPKAVPVNVNKVLNPDQIKEVIDILQTGELEELNGSWELLAWLYSGATGEVTDLEFLQNLLVNANDVDNLTESLAAALSTLSGLIPNQAEHISINFDMTEENLVNIQDLLKKIMGTPSSSMDHLTDEQVHAVTLLMKLAKVIELSVPYQQVQTIDPKQLSLFKETLGHWQDALSQLQTNEATKGTTDKGGRLINNQSYLQDLYTRSIQSTTVKQSLTNNSNEQTSTADTLLQGSSTVTIGDLQQVDKGKFSLTLERNGQAISSEEFVKNVENILQKATLTSANGMKKLLIRLTPEHLGTMRIELTEKDGVMVAKIMAMTSRGKELLDSQLHGLKHALTAQGIQMDKIEIQQQSSQLFDEKAFEEQPKEEQQQETPFSELEEEEEILFQDQLETAMINEKV